MKQRKRWLLNREIPDEWGEPIKELVEVLHRDGHTSEWLGIRVRLSSMRAENYRRYVIERLNEPKWKIVYDARHEGRYLILMGYENIEQLEIDLTLLRMATG